MKDLKNQRGIFLTSVAYKLFERLLMKRIEECTKNINLLQAGGRKGRSTADQTFIMRSIINHALYLGKKLFITCYDYKQCFDKLWLQEAVLSLCRLGLHSEYADLILKLNRKSSISINTPLGKTERFIAKASPKQGSVIGPTLCGASLGECLDLHEGGGASIGIVSIPALAFVDDINSMETSVRNVHSSHEKTVWFSEKKNQPLNDEKCEILCINSSPGDVVPTLVVNDKEVKNVDTITYVGDVFNEKGNNSDLIKDRGAKGIRCMRNTIAECDDITLGQYAIESLVLMYKAVFVQTILFNGEAWCNLTKQNEESLRVLQMKYLKRILHAPQSTPNIAVMMELGVKPIINEIHIRQLNYLHHIINMEESDPVKLVYNQQKIFEFEKTWYREVKVLLQKYDLGEDEEEIKKTDKLAWKAKVSKHVCAVVVQELNEGGNNGKITSCFLPITKLEVKKYMKMMSPNSARLMFKIRSKIVDLRGTRKYKYKDPSCRLCGDSVEDIDHVLNSCMHISRKGCISEDEIYGDDSQKLDEIVKRMNEFVEKIKVKESAKMSEQPEMTETDT